MKCFLLFLLWVFCLFFTKVWTSEQWYNVVVDLSHWNTNVSLALAKEDGIRGIIHKATEGLTYKDPTYKERKLKALNLGLNWGAYHFGRNESGRDQADFFLETAVDAENDGKKISWLPVLDVESTSSGFMTPQQAEDFVRRIFEVTGRLPIIYGNKYFLDSNGFATATLTSCPLWLARWGAKPVLPEGWSTLSLWQYTDGKQGPFPRTVLGIGFCDRSRFNGTGDEFRKFWLGE